jgi:diguanylate cyclase (GGDEF)-like protein
MDSVTRLLVVEDNPGDARLIQEELADSRAGGFRIEVAASFAAAQARLARSEEEVELVLLDLSLPDSRGLETFRQLHRQHPDLPILILSGLNDEAVAQTAVNEGAQDFLVKGRFDGGLLARSIRYAIERHRLLEEVRRLAIVDELTGIANRRGFLLLAEQELRVADRKRLPLALLYLDVDAFKSINDRLGHGQGDAALRQLASLLRRTFRRADVLGRVGGDEFCVLLMDGSEEAVRVAVARLLARLDDLNRDGDLPYRLSVSIGRAFYDPERSSSIEGLIAAADGAMYQDKQQRKRGVA